MTESDWCTAQQVRLLLTAEETFGRVSVVERIAQHGTAVPRHRHAHEDEIVCVLSGEIIYQVGTERHQVSSGACLFMPRGSEHSHIVASKSARLLIILVPAGLEGLHRDLAQPDEVQGGLVGVERLVTLSSRYGVEITGPPLDHEFRNASDGQAIGHGLHRHSDAE